MTRIKLAPLVADLVILAAVTLVLADGASWRTLTAAGGAAVVAHVAWMTGKDGEGVTHAPIRCNVLGCTYCQPNKPRPRREALDA